MRKKRIKKNKMGRHKSWWNNKNLGLWLSRYQYHCTIWLINTVWQFIKNLAKVTKRSLIEVCVEMIIIAILFFWWINVYKIDNHMCCNTSLKIPYPTFSLLFFDFLGVFFWFCFVFCSCLANYEKKQFYENVHVIATCMVSRCHLITTHLILYIETADNN